jgi:hypothetical protein
MKTIHKYPLGVGAQIIGAPVDARPIHVGLDPAGARCIWMMVDTKFPIAGKAIMLTGTGVELPEEFSLDDLAPRHVGSFVEGNFVWHVLAIN